jgi:hypothetical protein
MSFRGATRRGIPQNYVYQTSFEGFLSHFVRSKPVLSEAEG